MSPGRPHFSLAGDAIPWSAGVLHCYHCAMRKDDKKRIAARLAKVLAMMCVRNTKLENLHAGLVPVTKTGD